MKLIKLIMLIILLTGIIIFADNLKKNKKADTPEKIFNSIWYEYYNGTDTYLVMLVYPMNNLKIDSSGLIADTSGVATTLNIINLQKAISDSFYILVNQTKQNGDSSTLIFGKLNDIVNKLSSFDSETQGFYYDSATYIYALNSGGDSVLIEKKIEKKWFPLSHNVKYVYVNDSDGNILYKEPE